jgi:hypothetical protein
VGWGFWTSAAAFHVAVQNANSETNGKADPNQEQDILHMSHGVRLIFFEQAVICVKHGDFL